MKTVGFHLGALALLTACSSPEPLVGPGDPDAGAAPDATPPSSTDAATDGEGDASRAQVRCEAGSRPGAIGATDGITTTTGLHFNLRTPDGYDPTVGYPVIVVFAPSGGTAASIEASTKLTPDAIAAGFVIAYVDTVSPANVAGAKDAAKVPDVIASRWCIDRQRVYLTGSSDGGGLIYTIVLNHYMSPMPAAIAPFAAGASKRTLDQATCLSPPMPVMIMHNADDAVFPMYGRAARDWWIGCNACGAGQPLADRCLGYEGCSEGAEVRYCEGSGGHGRWPGLHASMFGFFRRFTARSL